MGRGGRSRGWRRRNWYHATGLPGWMRFGNAPRWVPPTAQPELEAETLKVQAKWLQTQLDTITERLNELEQQS
jgi:hypothetical protein